MIKRLIALTIFGLLLYSCSTVDQTQNESTKATDQQSVSDSSIPTWYSHKTRALRDSTTFTGLGMAVSIDSSSAAEQATTQAKSHMMYSIDAYVEDMRNKLIEDGDVGTLQSTDTILSIREAVQSLNIGDNLLTADIMYKTDEESVTAYSKLSVDRTAVVEKLSTVIEHSQLVDAIRSGTDQGM